VVRRSAEEAGTDEFAMGATTQIRPTQTRRQVTGAAAAAFGPGAAGFGESFKMSPCAADLQRLGRHLAADLREVCYIPFLATNLLNSGTRIDHRTTVGPSTADRRFDGKLTAAVPAARPTETAAAATDDRAGAFWIETRRIVSTAPGDAREIQCDADV